MLNPLIKIFSDNGSIKFVDSGEWNHFNLKVLRCKLQRWDFDGSAHLSLLDCRTPLGFSHMEMLICVPYAKDLPVYTLETYRCFSKETALIEYFNTLLRSVDISSLYDVKKKYNYLKDKYVLSPWYDSTRIDPQCSKEGNRADIERLLCDMTASYVKLFASRAGCSLERKFSRNDDLVENFITHRCFMFSKLQDALSARKAADILRGLLFCTMK